MSRKSGVVDVILPPSREPEAGEESVAEPHGARLLCTLREDRMRVGAERWVGLKITEGYVSVLNADADVEQRCSELYFWWRVPLYPSVEFPNSGD